MAGVSHRNMIFGVLVSVTILKLFIPTSTYICFPQSICTIYWNQPMLFNYYY